MGNVVVPLPQQQQQQQQQQLYHPIQPMTQYYYREIIVPNVSTVRRFVSWKVVVSVIIVVYTSCGTGISDTWQSRVIQMQTYIRWQYSGGLCYIW
jgi:hypothetical protein